MDWQPIETAPKDGSTFFAAWPADVGGHTVAKWLADEGCFADGYRHRLSHIAWWMPIQDLPTD